MRTYTKSDITRPSSKLQPNLVQTDFLLLLQAVRPQLSTLVAYSSAVCAGQLSYIALAPLSLSSFARIVLHAPSNYNFQRPRKDVEGQGLVVVINLGRATLLVLSLK
jgi:hypothetical protein